RGDHFYVTPTSLTSGGAVFAFFAIDVEITEQVVIARTAERTAQARKFPFRRTQPAAEQARLLQTAEFPQERPAAAGRTITLPPGRPRLGRGEGGMEPRQHRKQRQT